MNLIFIGPQASGKGTQGKIIAEKFGLCHISMGDLLRNYTGDGADKIKEIVSKGELVPIGVTIQLIKNRINEDDCKKGFIFDGFPRTVEQAELIKDFIKFDRVFEIFLSDGEVLRRLSGRLTCNKCGRVYNEVTNPKPKKKGVCDVCGGELYKRKDDTEESIKTRLRIYNKETMPVLEYYTHLDPKLVIRVNGNQEIAKVTDDILEGLGEA